MTIRVRAPATTANIGPGFDCAAAALDLWNELDVRDDEAGDGLDESDLVVQAFSRLAPVTGRSFLLTERIPRGRGLGSSAAAIVLGLVAGAIAAGVDEDADSLLALGLDLEGHPDNLAAALAGGVCLTWDGRIARIADDLPAAGLALVPAESVSTNGARAALPELVPHADAAFTVARAALLGAAIASHSSALFAAATDDRLHEPYRAGHVPLLAELRSSPPAGMLGATISGSGPTVMVWTRPDLAESCRRELAARFPTVSVLHLAVSSAGAGPR